VRNRWRQFRGFFSRRVRYKVTRAGLLFVLAILAIGFAAIASANNLLFLIVAAMLATLLISGFVSRLCLAGLELDFLVPEHVPAGRHVPGKLFVRNQKWLMPSFSVRVEAVRSPDSPSLKSGVYFPLIASHATLEETVEVRFPRRGIYRQNGFAFSTSFPFGFLEKSARVTLRRETLVYPSLDPHPGFDDLLFGIDGEIETHYRGLGKDFYRIRPYEVLESAHHVDWKASAHVGVLQVREFAREQEQRPFSGRPNFRYRIGSPKKAEQLICKCVLCSGGQADGERARGNCIRRSSGRSSLHYVKCVIGIGDLWRTMRRGIYTAALAPFDDAQARLP
jgi:hypothetical protein